MNAKTNGFRVLATLEFMSLQCFHTNPDGDEVEHDGNTLTSGTATHFNNVDDLEVDASFTIECSESGTHSVR